jgi:O-antigen/teichoic acid export membrane protein
MALTGAAISFFIVGQRGGAALGVFSQVYAIYVVAAQVAALGVHDSAQKHAAQYSDDPAELRALSRAALGLALVTAAVVGVALALCSPLVELATDSPAVGRGVLVVAPGVVLFAMNKALLGVLNGLRRMRAYAVAQAARVLTILTVVVAVGMTSLPAWALVAAFVVAEVVVFVGLLGATWPLLAAERATGVNAWRARHFHFGLRALPNGLLAESFVRIDVIMLGLFVSDAEVGVYSFVAFFVEGLIQIPVVVRTVVNPVFVKLLQRDDKAAVARLSRRAGGASWGLTAVVAVAVYLAFPVLGPWLGADLVARGHELLAVLSLGLVVYAAFLPSDTVLLQAGLPGRQSALMAVNTMVSIVLNGLLISAFGVRGAAFATAAAYGWSAVALTVAAAWWVGMNRSLFIAPREPGR